MNTQQQNTNITIQLTIEEVNAVLSIIVQAPVPYNVSHPLIQKLAGQIASRSATPPNSEIDNNATEHAY